MSALLDLAHQCAVTIGKSDNMRVTAAKFCSQAIDMLKTDQGVMDAIAEGVEPNLKGFHVLVSSDPAYPKSLVSFSSFRRLLQIAKAPDPEVEDARLRRDQSERNACYKSDLAESANVTEMPSHAEVSVEVLPKEPHPLFNAAKHAVQEMNREELTLFNTWYQGYHFQTVGPILVKKADAPKPTEPDIKGDLGRSEARPGTAEFQEERKAQYARRAAEKKARDEEAF